MNTSIKCKRDQAGGGKHYMQIKYLLWNCL